MLFRFSPIFAAGFLLLIGCLPWQRGLDLVVTNVNIVDLVTGTVQESRRIEIDNGTIVAIRPMEAPGRSTSTEVFDADGGFALPGLWDMHVHTLWNDEVARSFLPLFVEAGVTGIRDMGGDLEVLAAIRSIDDPSWPRIVAAGSLLDGPEPRDPSLAKAIDNPTEARWTVARLASKGADFIHLSRRLSRTSFLAAAAAAAELELQLVGQPPAEVSIEEAVDVGLASLEETEGGHFCADLSNSDCAELTNTLTRQQVHLTSSLTAIQSQASRRFSASTAEVDQLPPIVRNYWDGVRSSLETKSEAYFSQRQEDFRSQLDMFGSARESQVPILVGTDTGSPFLLPGVSLHRELSSLVASGYSPREALHAATLGAARFLGFENAGALEVGWAADLVLFRFDPTQDIEHLESILAVVRAGHLIEPSSSHEDR